MLVLPEVIWTTHIWPLFVARCDDPDAGVVGVFDLIRIGTCSTQLRHDADCVLPHLKRRWLLARERALPHCRLRDTFGVGEPGSYHSATLHARPHNGVRVIRCRDRDTTVVDYDLGASPVIHVSLHGDFAVCIEADGSCWDFRVGPYVITTPRRLNNITRAVSAHVGRKSAMVLTADGTVYCRCLRHGPYDTPSGPDWLPWVHCPSAVAVLFASVNHGAWESQPLVLARNGMMHRIDGGWGVPDQSTLRSVRGRVILRARRARPCGVPTAGTLVIGVSRFPVIMFFGVFGDLLLFTDHMATVRSIVAATCEADKAGAPCYLAKDGTVRASRYFVCRLCSEIGGRVDAHADVVLSPRVLYNATTVDAGRVDRAIRRGYGRLIG